MKSQNQQNQTAPQLQITYSSCFLIRLPSVFLHTAVRLIFPNTFSSCHSFARNPSIAAQYQQHNVHIPWPGIKPPLQSGSNFLFLPHFPLFPCNVAAYVNSLLQSTQLPLKRRYAFFFSCYFPKLFIAWGVPLRCSLTLLRHILYCCFGSYHTLSGRITCSTNAS